MRIGACRRGRKDEGKCGKAESVADLWSARRRRSDKSADHIVALDRRRPFGETKVDT